MAMAYRKKPVVVEAVQWTGENHAEMCEFIEPEAFEIIPRIGLVIHTLEGDHHASPGDYIIKGVNGEFYPCKPDIFAKTYESSTLTPPNEPLTQADLDGMDYDKVWIDYGDDGEWALVVSGRIYALAVLEGAGFEDILRDEVDGETMDRPSGNYTVYRCPPEAKDNNVPTKAQNEPLTLEQLREMDGEPVWVELYLAWALVEVKQNGSVMFYGNSFSCSYSRTWHVYRFRPYRRPPEGEGNA